MNIGLSEAIVVLLIIGMPLLMAAIIVLAVRSGQQRQDRSAGPPIG
jgi:hypothetical protein